jgi:branched-chain amino acid transport system ATP-binding protein
MLAVRDISVSYSGAPALHGLSLDVAAGEILCVLGRNGAGKSTTMKAIMGLLPLDAGSIELEGVDISKLPAEEIPRRLFAELTVAENLEIGLMVNSAGAEVRERVLDIFPRLRERLKQQAVTLSGGEQQMLATARALCIEPKVLLLDEPTEGLQPSMIEQIRQVISLLRDQNVAIILVEQRVDAVLSLADKVSFVEHGVTKATMDADELRNDTALLTHYLGVT